jgi:hypothetical protein
MHLVHNERTKLTAGWLNTLATALVAAGAFAPAAAWLFGLSASLIAPDHVLWSALGCIGLAAVIHRMGWMALGRLRE